MSLPRNYISDRDETTVGADFLHSCCSLASFPGANDKYTLDRLLLNFTGRSHLSVPNRFLNCIPLKGWLGTWYMSTIGIMVKKEEKVFCNADFKKLGITFKKCKRSIQLLFSESSRTSVSVSLMFQPSICFCEFGLWCNIKMRWQTGNRRTSAFHAIVTVV